LDRIWADAPLTGLVNNAAGNFLSRSEDLSLKGFDAIANTVFRGTFALTHNCSRRWLAEGRRASVLSILATWIWNGSAFTVPSAMAKSGIKTMTQSLAVEWGGRGIRLNAIAPGPFPTEGVRARLRPGMSEDDAFANARHDNPMGRVGRPSELANLAAFLMSPGAEFINGEIIAIDGAGWLAGGGNFAHLRHWGDAEWAEARSNIRAADAADRSARG
ncbi:MAG: SDR family oxidoreductase, partial [Sphingomonadales bacterium]